MSEATGDTPPAGEPSGDTEPDQPMLALLMASQRRAWRRGERIPVEDYLAQQPQVQGDAQAILDMIYHEIVLREEAGESPELEEYQRRFPELAAELELQSEIERAFQCEPTVMGREHPTILGGSGPSPAPLGGPALPGYQILGELGRGGMGVVYKARQLRLNRIVGSPSYMAPEQPGEGGGPIGPWADLYSLRAILYELITGRPPFQAATVLETLEQVRSVSPLAPARLRPELPRDLDTVCLKCLEKDPARRYDSAAGLAEDLRRFAAGEAIRARPVGRPERLSRWCRREPALAALALTLVAGLFGVATQWLRAESHLEEALPQRGRAEANLTDALQQRNRAEQNARKEVAARRRAQGRFDAAMTALGNVEKITKDAALLREPRLEGLRARLLQTALDFYQELQSSLGEDASPGARLQLSEAYARVAQVTWEL
jgi:hypothetical protein